MAVEVVVVRTVAAAVSYTAVVGNTVVAVVESQAVEPGCKVEPPRGGGCCPHWLGHYWCYQVLLTLVLTLLVLLLLLLLQGCLGSGGSALESVNSV